MLLIAMFITELFTYYISYVYHKSQSSFYGNNTKCELCKFFSQCCISASKKSAQYKCNVNSLLIFTKSKLYAINLRYFMYPCISKYV
jgi:hypothetical protein